MGVEAGEESIGNEFRVSETQLKFVLVCEGTLLAVRDPKQERSVTVCGPGVSKRMQSLRPKPREECSGLWPKKCLFCGP